jgi:hypothetical protein
LNGLGLLSETPITSFLPWCFFTGSTFPFTINFVMYSYIFGADTLSILCTI